MLASSAAAASFVAVIEAAGLQAFLEAGPASASWVDRSDAGEEWEEVEESLRFAFDFGLREAVRSWTLPLLVVVVVLVVVAFIVMVPFLPLMLESWSPDTWLAISLIVWVLVWVRWDDRVNVSMDVVAVSESDLFNGSMD